MQILDRYYDEYVDDGGDDERMASILSEYGVPYSEGLDFAAMNDGEGFLGEALSSVCGADEGDDLPGEDPSRERY